jgi:hypothetical protein
MIAQEDEPEMMDWLQNAASRGGGFISLLAVAALHADSENYPILRPALLELRRKYPKYDRLRGVAL